MIPTIDKFQQTIIDGIHDLKGKSVCVVDMSHIESAPVSSFIIAEGTSAMQVGSIADRVREYVQEHAGVKPFNYDGYANSEWIVIDYGDTLVHVFQREERTRYNLEELWSDAVITEIPDLD